MKRLLALLAVSLLIAVPALADAPCAGSYETARSTITSMRLGRGLEMKLLTKVENAWRIYRGGKKNAQKNALQQIEQVLKLLDRNSTKALPPSVRASVQKSVDDFRRCIESGNLTTASLTVRVLQPRLENPSTMELVAGAIIRINGEEVGLTSTVGTVVLDVPTGETVVDAIVYPASGATKTINLSAGSASTVELLLDDASPRERSVLSVDEAPEGALPSGFSSFTFRFLDLTGHPIPMSTVEAVDVMASDGSRFTYWGSRFGVAADGGIRPNDLNTWRDALHVQSGKVDVAVTGMDTRGRLHFGRFAFHLARFTVQGRLVAPPSNPSLDVGGLHVFANILNTDLVFRTITAADGSFALPELPRGNLEISAETVADGKSYYGLAVNSINMDTRFIVNMLHTSDVIQGVPLYSIEPLVLAAAVIEPPPDRERESRGGAFTFPFVRRIAASGIAPTADTSSVSTSATGGARDAAVTRTATLTVPQGTPSIVLRYQVSTHEYPFYVLSQSVYNDWWYLDVRAATNGAQLFRRLRQINSQLSLEPVWQPDGSTGELQYELDTQTLTQFGPADVTVLASTANIGDGALATTVTATLSRNFEVSINFIDKDAVVPTEGSSDRFSIPRAGQSNVHQRSLNFGVVKPAGSIVTNVKVWVNGVSGFAPVPLQPPSPIVDEVPGGTAVTPIAGSNNYRVRVTFDGTTSPFTTTPPQAPRIRYKIRVTVDHNGATKTAERETETYYPLWRMPDGLPRYGHRDAGEDDWCSLGTYFWLDVNRSLISQIDDISGEHARDIGHDWHYDGRDIDIFHYYHMPGAWNGESNYNLLRLNASRMLNADPDVRAESRQQVTNWVSAMRNGLAPLSDLTDVDALLMNRGTAGSGLPYGWAWSLLTTGVTTVGGSPIDLGLGPWNCTKCQPRTDHEDHSHIRLIDEFF
jgi:hypothetical protein